jgi:hypothetical protein
VTPTATGPDRTPDGRYVVIDGRRWRATDPSIPEPLAAELRRALMKARRDVGERRRDGDAAGERDARRRVHAAKVALGERGTPWWEPSEQGTQRERISATIATLVGARPGGSVCPSEVARAVGGATWRSLMEPTRAVAADLAAEGEVVITQKGVPVDAPWRGPVRIGAPAGST